MDGRGEKMQPPVRREVTDFDLTCSSCRKPLTQPVVLGCGHSPVCLKCTDAKPVQKCSVCDTKCRKRKRTVNLTLNGALRILHPDMYAPVARDEDECLRTARDMIQCKVCNDLPIQPVLLTRCGHSPYCWTCWCRAKPRNCPICFERITTKDVIMNQTLQALLQNDMASDYEGRPMVDVVTHEYDTQISNLATKIDEYGRLPLDYMTKATEIIDKDRAQTGNGKTPLVRMCGCELVCLPKKSKAGRFFFGCPMWKPGSVVRTKDTEVDPDVAYHCKMFAFLSKRQIEVLGL